ncbi:MAG TPA: MFS transporter [Acidimicrobiales bacterium]
MRRLPFLRSSEPNFEETEGAVLGGDVPYAPGSARAAFAHRAFRRVWLGSMASNVGTWMQNVALGAFAYELTESSGYVALLGFAQLGPLLLLSIVGGLLADTVDRRWLLIGCQVEQMILSFVLAAVAAGDDPSRTALFLCVLAIGIGNAFNAPTFSAVLPQLVGKRDLVGAVSLQSVQLNLSRVVGPAIGGAILPAIGASGVFAVNGVTYLFAIATLFAVTIPRPYPEYGEQGWRRLVGGFAVARRDRLVRRCLLTIAAISFFCLPFVGLLPVIAARNLGIDVEGAAYGALYACFGLGAACGAVAVGTLLVGRDKAAAVRAGLALFAISLAAFGLLRVPAPAYPVAFLVGLFYFGAVTSLSSVLQQHLDESVRGRVMALWIMGFGGTVPIGLLVFGVLAEAASVTAVVLVGAVVAALLAVLANVRARPA